MDAAFTKILQIGIAVYDIQARIKGWEVFGIGPWTIREHKRMVRDGDKETEVTEAITAVFMMNGISLELVQPTLEDLDQARFLREKGEGIYHFGFEHTDHFFKAIEKSEAKEIMSLVFQGRKCVLFDTEEELGVITELYFPIKE